MARRLALPQTETIPAIETAERQQQAHAHYFRPEGEDLGEIAGRLSAGLDHFLQERNILEHQDTYTRVKLQPGSRPNENYVSFVSEEGLPEYRTLIATTPRQPDQNPTDDMSGISRAYFNHRWPRETYEE